MSRALRLLVVVALYASIIACTAAAVRADDWLPIPPEDLALKDNPAQSGADAMVLYRSSLVSARDVSTGGDFDEEYIRIKVFTQAGVRNGDVEVRFFKEQTDVKDVRGRTIHPDGSIINFSGKVLEKEIVRRSGLRYLAKTFSLPDVQPGSIIEYQYTVQGTPHYLHDEQWTISTDLFTREAHFAYVPYSGYSGYIPMVRTRGLPKDAQPKCAIDGKCTMVAHDVPAVVDEALMPPEKLLEARVEFYYVSTGDPHGESTEQYWSRINKKLNGELEHFIDKKAALSAQVAQVVTPNDSPEQKLRKIYARVLKVRNLSFEESRTKKEERDEQLKKINNVEDVLNNNYGSGRDINMLFIGLARAAGFDSSEVWIATRNDHLFAPESQDVRELNSELVWASAGGKDYYLDPGAKFFGFGTLPWYETNDNGLRTAKQGPVTITTPIEDSTYAVIARNADLTMNDMGELTGTIRIDFDKQEGASRRASLQDEDEIGRQKKLEDEIKSWLPTSATLDNVTVSNWDNVEEPLRVEAKLKVAGFTALAVRRVLMPAELFRDSELRAFESERRVNGIYFHFSHQVVDDIKFHVPDSFKISLPSVAKIDKGAAVYELTATSQGNVAEVKRQLNINGIAFPKEVYPTLRAFFSAAKAGDDAQIVLQNAQSAQN